MKTPLSPLLSYLLLVKAFSIFAFLVACTPAMPGADGPTITGGPTFVSLVGYEKSPVGDVSAAVAAGQLVVVKYDGKSMARVGCAPATTYKWLSTTAHSDTMESESESDFRAHLPPIEGVSVDALTQFKAGNAVRFKTVSMGMWRAEPLAALPPECKGATHYVSSITTGAYAMSTRQHATWTVAQTSSSKGGNPDACSGGTSDATAPPSGCDVAVGVSLSAVP